MKRQRHQHYNQLYQVFQKDQERDEYFNYIEETKKHNSELINSIRKENKELKGVQENLNNQKKKQGSTKNQKEEKTFSKVECLDSWRNKVNGIKNAIEKKQKVLMNLQDKLNELNVAGTFNTEETPQHKRIKILENELDKIIIKYNEAQSIRKTYEQIVKKIKEERVGFDNQIQIIKKTLKNKQKDLKDLSLLANKAIHAKEISLNEFKLFKKEQEKIKKKQRDYIDQKKQEIDQKLQKIDRKQSQQQKENEEALEEEQKQQRQTLENDPTLLLDLVKIKDDINMYEQAFKEIKKNTGAIDINEIIQKYIVQEETQNSLEQLKETYYKRIEEQQEVQLQLKQEIENLKESFDIKEHKKRIEGIDIENSEVNRKLEEEKLRCEYVTDVLIQFQSGIEHLYNKLQFVELEEHINFNNEEDESQFIKMIKNLNQKVKVVYEVVKKDQKANKIFKKNFTDEENLIVFQNYVDPNLYVEHCVNEIPVVQNNDGLEEQPSEEESQCSQNYEEQNLLVFEIKVVEINKNIKEYKYKQIDRLIKIDDNLL